MSASTERGSLMQKSTCCFYCSLHDMYRSHARISSVTPEKKIISGHHGMIKWLPLPQNHYFG